MNRQKLILLGQMYKKTGKTHNFHSYINVTSDPELLENLNKLSPRATELVWEMVSQLKRANSIEDDQLIDRFIVQIEWDSKDYNRAYRARMLNELYDINLITKVGNREYLMNPLYFNCLTHSQLNILLQQSFGETINSERQPTTDGLSGSPMI